MLYLCCFMKPYAGLQNILVNSLACCMLCVCLVSIYMSLLNQKHSGCQKIQLAFKLVSYRLIKQRKNFTLTSRNIWCLQTAPPAVEIPLEMTCCIMLWYMHSGWNKFLYWVLWVFIIILIIQSDWQQPLWVRKTVA